MAELDLAIVYRPGEKNVVADVFSYGDDRVAKTTASAWYCLGNSSIRRVVYEWLTVVAKHLDFDACATAAIDALSQ